jgi:hypothetical protein
MEQDVHPVVAILDYANTAQVRQAPGDRTTPVGGRAQVLAAVGINVPVAAEDCNEPRIVDSTAGAIFGGVGWFVGDTEAFAKAELQVNWRHILL